MVLSERLAPVSMYLLPTYDVDSCQTPRNRHLWHAHGTSDWKDFVSSGLRLLEHCHTTVLELETWFPPTSTHYLPTLPAYMSVPRGCAVPRARRPEAQIFRRPCFSALVGFCNENASYWSVCGCFAPLWTQWFENMTPTRGHAAVSSHQDVS